MWRESSESYDGKDLAHRQVRLLAHLRPSSRTSPHPSQLEPDPAWGGSTFPFLLWSPTVCCAIVLLQSLIVIITRVQQPRRGTWHVVATIAIGHRRACGPAQGLDHRCGNRQRHAPPTGDSHHTRLGKGRDSERGRWERVNDSSGIPPPWIPELGNEWEQMECIGSWGSRGIWPRKDPWFLDQAVWFDPIGWVCLVWS
jgi:hypothetical protein